MVETVGVEPTSESSLQLVSPSAVSYFLFFYKLQLTGFCKYIIIPTPSAMITYRVSCPTDWHRIKERGNSLKVSTA